MDVSLYYQVTKGNIVLYKDFSLAAQTGFAGLDGAARQADLERSIADVPGGFSKKKVAGRDYWYYQIKMPDGVLQQSYVGPNDDKTNALIQAHSDPSKRGAKKYLDRLTKAAIAMGCAEIPLKHARVIERLADSGLFSAGGILVGTHAFLAYQNIFGVEWSSGVATLDLDFAHAGRNISLALPENLVINTKSAIDSLQMGFVPNNSKTSFKKADEPDFDLDFLTSRGRAGDTPVYIERLGLTMQPLRFMELSLEDPMRTTLIGKNSPIVVNIPRPQRYALHKLLVYGERPQDQRTKANKDIIQAAALFDYLLENDVVGIGSMWIDVNERGPGWQRRLEQGFAAMVKFHPECDFPARLKVAVEKAREDQEFDFLADAEDKVGQDALSHLPLSPFLTETLAPLFSPGQKFDFKAGDQVIANGYRGTIGSVLDGQLAGMIEVHLPGGLACMSSSFPDCFPAVTNGVEVVTEGRFLGKVLEVGKQFVVQDAGRGRLVGHEKSRFSVLPEVDAVIDLAHKGGQVEFMNVLEVGKEANGR